MTALTQSGLGPCVSAAIAARQLVRHKHILLNGKRVNIPSIRIKPGDMIALRAQAVKIPMVMESLKEPALTRPEWIPLRGERTTSVRSVA